ncbi:MAG TPA: signal recognition particle protein [Ruminococcaceae bacterium]|nr:signal recognition particle protein [Oscillospiraceae bacterium]
MAFESLSEKFSAVFKRLKSKGKLSESDVKEVLREVRLALLEADVNYKVAKDFVAKVGERAVGAEVMESLTPAQTVIRIVDEELTALMGGGESRLNSPASPPAAVLLCGLQGSGKTTLAGKLGLMLREQGRRPLLVAGDVYRPAAIRQLQVVGERAGVPVFERGAGDPVKISRAAVKHAKDYGNDIVLIDTAGRLQIDEKLMGELKNIRAAVHPTDILLVVDAMTGQEAVNVAKSFNDLLDITGVVLTKLDGDARGGAALSVRAVTGKPIKFASTGEKLSDLEVFHPDRMASRILGMGDVLTLIEDAQKNLDRKKAQQAAQKMMHSGIDLNDMLGQMRQMKKMGPLKDVLAKVPGMSKQLKDVDVDDRMVDRTEAILLSMTPRERERPEVINPSRKRRIARGSGMRVEDVNRLLRNFEQTRRLMKQFKKKGVRRRFSGMKMPF